MPADFFLDTNIFVYSFDKKEVAKQARARELVRAALQGDGCASWQVVQEFSNVAIRGFVAAFDHTTLRISSMGRSSAACRSSIPFADAGATTASPLPA